MLPSPESLQSKMGNNFIIMLFSTSSSARIGFLFRVVFQQVVQPVEQVSL